MICEEVRDNLVARLDDELDVPTRAAVDAHVASCRACARELAELRVVGRTVGLHLSRSPAPPREASFEALWARAAAEAGEASGRGFGFGRRPGGRASVDPGTRAGSMRSGGWRTAARLSAIGGSLAAAAVALVVAATLRPGPQPSAGGGTTSPPAAAVAAKPAAPRAVAAAPQGERAPAKVASRPSDVAPSAVQLARGKAQEPEAGPSGRDLQVPDEVRKHPGMFLDLPIVQRLEKLRNMEAVYRDSAAAEGSG